MAGSITRRCRCIAYGFDSPNSGPSTPEIPKIRPSSTSLNTGWRQAMMHSHPHVHPKQPDLEDAPFTEYQVMAQALEELLLAKGMITAEAMRQGIEAMDAPTPADGAQLVARCWVNPA